MRFSLVTLTALGVVSAALYGMSRQSTTDFGPVTGSIGQLGGVSRPTPAAAKSERLTAQLVLPDDPVGDLTGPASLVLAQSPPMEELAQAPAATTADGGVSSQGQGGGTGQAAGAQGAQAQPAVDESALRYFAARGDNARLQAEISRLRTLYPN